MNRKLTVMGTSLGLVATSTSLSTNDGIKASQTQLSSLQYHDFLLFHFLKTELTPLHLLLSHMKRNFV